MGLITKGLKDWIFVSKRVLLIAFITGFIVSPLIVFIFVGFNLTGFAELFGNFISFIIMNVVFSIIFLIGWAFGHIIEASIGFFKYLKK